MIYLISLNIKLYKVCNKSMLAPSRINFHDKMVLQFMLQSRLLQHNDITFILWNINIIHHHSCPPLNFQMIVKINIILRAADCQFRQISILSLIFVSNIKSQSSIQNCKVKKALRNQSGYHKSPKVPC